MLEDFKTTTYVKMPTLNLSTVQIDFRVLPAHLPAAHILGLVLKTSVSL